ncbi:L,D-transpeptidase [Arthrobacter sp. ISL-5]|uniref:L,D-transpeptidase n=1 Tax=Arthrobacter sp. ISL-5 TaxID=2819111 RepID=UPI001BE78E56|nr:L,D-transpeptidase [Arthrobacter sp. ISL-5]MBT2556093.1 L,D-transpeptidase [Arthrobacter sp. ISL-5]
MVLRASNALGARLHPFQEVDDVTYALYTLPSASCDPGTNHPFLPHWVTKVARAGTHLDGPTKTAMQQHRHMEMHEARRPVSHTDRPSLPAVTFHLDQANLISSLQGSIGNHAVQRLLASDPVVQRYRRPGAMNFGDANGSALVEKSFRSKTKQPWLSLIAVTFDSVTLDDDGLIMPKGTATATYFANSHALASFSVRVTGGPFNAPTDSGTFTVHRIEGVGYNDAISASKMPKSQLEGPNFGGRRRYTKPTKSGGQPATMHLAVFYNRGEALHIGGATLASHGCVHVADWDRMAQLNYHSVIGLTKITVDYSGISKWIFGP